MEIGDFLGENYASLDLWSQLFFRSPTMLRLVVIVGCKVAFHAGKVQLQAQNRLSEKACHRIPCMPTEKRSRRKEIDVTEFTWGIGETLRFTCDWFRKELQNEEWFWLYCVLGGQFMSKNVLHSAEGKWYKSRRRKVVLQQSVQASLLAYCYEQNRRYERRSWCPHRQPARIRRRGSNLGSDQACGLRSTASSRPEPVKDTCYSHKQASWFH